MFSDSLVVVMADQPMSMSEWLPTLAAILAAVAAFFAAVYGPAVQRRQALEQRIAEARHAWLTQFRDQMSQLLLAIAQTRDRILRQPVDPAVAHETFEKLTLHIIHVRLMLDRAKPQHEKLASVLDRAMKSTSPKFPEHADYSQLMLEAEFAARDLLDEAWTRIKTGR